MCTCTNEHVLQLALCDGGGGGGGGGGSVYRYIYQILC